MNQNKENRNNRPYTVKHNLFRKDTVVASTEKELGAAIADSMDSIEIEGDLQEKIIKLKASGKVAWGALISCTVLGGGCIALTFLSGGTTAAVTGPMGGAAVLGTSIAGGSGTALFVWTLSAGVIAATGSIVGGIRAMKSLSKYRLEKRGSRVLLKRCSDADD